ncbi:ATP-dependent sacrificial sulfur transferase LarE [Haloglycomyces albus]|uniref:ATP-dependent sacrificial sulfur transferase LarE n=1 Tax=Haloglycomyces albus TaxID=526067 RepID=UPI00046D646F|nr:ATP-dependent sacrificial sulfur transferase LarE [Haloglycomyces albus]
MKGTVKVDQLLSRLASLDSLLVAFSGGADSAFLLAAATKALGSRRVAAATALSPSLPEAEVAAARDFAAELGVRHYLPETNELQREGYRRNAGDRCFFCKTELMSVLGPLAESEGFAHIATGTNADDTVAGFRPGIRAGVNAGALIPLADAELTKDEVRAQSREWGLRTWDKPAAACLSSRIAYGIEITPSHLARVGQAEADLRDALRRHDIPVRNLRVRDMGDDSARVEIDAELVSELETRPDVLDSVVGFTSVTVDPQGFRSGAMNELLADPARYR